jgi:acetyltransferase-like isoleucine patch superfamily enzyme
VQGKITIGENVWKSFASSGGCYIQGANGIEIGDNTIFAAGIKIISSNHQPGNMDGWVEERPIKIGKNCWIGANAVILPGVELGDHVIVGAGAIVTKSFPSGVIIAGNPARILENSRIKEQSL